jgi:hypothetical protein
MQSGVYWKGRSKPTVGLSFFYAALSLAMLFVGVVGIIDGIIGIIDTNSIGFYMAIVIAVIGLMMGGRCIITFAGWQYLEVTGYQITIKGYMQAPITANISDIIHYSVRPNPKQTAAKISFKVRRGAQWRYGFLWGQWWQLRSVENYQELISVLEQLNVDRV